MFTFGIMAGIFIAWLWLALTSPQARKERKGYQFKEIRCSHCGRTDWIPRSEVRTTNYCERCR